MIYKKTKYNFNQNTINVLQIIPNNSAECTWNLATDTTFQNLFDNVKDFNVKISTITVGQYETQYSANATYLNQYNMLIIDFAMVLVMEVVMEEIILQTFQRMALRESWNLQIQERV